MLPFARHAVLVFADSDVHAAPDYLDRLAAPLALLPLRDLLSLGLIAASYHGGHVKWRGQVVPLDQPRYLLRQPPSVPYRATQPALGD
jgi:hypothetical protein